jgi:acyl-CoA thioesterase
VDVNGTKQATSPAQRLRDLREVVESGLAAGIGVGHSLGVLLESLEDGRAVWSLTPSPATANAMFVVHGGVLATLMDTAMGSAVFTKLPESVFYTTLELKVNFIRTVQLDGDRLTCVGQTIHVGKRTATAEARVTDPAGKLVAHGSCTCMLFTPTDQS